MGSPFLIILFFSAAYALAGCSSNYKGGQEESEKIFNSKIAQAGPSSSIPLVLPGRHLGNPEEFSPSRGGHIGLLNRVQTEIYYTFSRINATESDPQTLTAKKIQFYEEIRDESFEIAKKQGFLSGFSPLAFEYFPKILKSILACNIWSGGMKRFSLST